MLRMYRRTAIAKAIGLAQGLGLFMMGGGAGKLFTSEDSLSWTQRSNPLGSYNVVAMAYGNGVYIIGTNNGGIATSTDLVNWTARASGATSVRSIFFDDGKFYLLTDAGFCRISFDNGITWYGYMNFASQMNDSIVAIGKIVLVGNSGQARVSDNHGANFSTLSGKFNNEHANTITFGKGLFVVGTSNSGIWSSPDGVTWTQRLSSAGAGGSYNVGGVAFGNNIFVAALGNKLWKSTDGISWTLEATLAQNVNRYRFCKDRFIAVCGSGKAYYTTDGSNWNPITIGFGTEPIYEVLY